MKAIIATCCVLVGCKADEQNLGFTTPTGERARWAVALGGAGEDRGMATAIDSIGDVVVVGDYHGPADFGHGPLTTGGPFGYVTKRVASDGSERWTVMLVGPTGSYSDVMGVAIDGDDSVIVAGGYSGQIDFGGTVLVGPSDLTDSFVAKYSWDGHLTWVHPFGADASSWATAAAVDAAGQIYVAGDFAAGTLVFGSDTYVERDDNDDAYLAAIDPSGSLVWGHAFQGANGPAITNIAVAPNRDVIAVGEFGGPTSFGGAVLSPDAFDRGFMTRFRSDGLFLSSRAIGEGGAGRSIATQVAVTPDHLVVVQTQESDAGLSSVGGLHALTAGNDEMWSAQIPERGSLDALPRTLAITPDGAIISSAWTDHVEDGTGNLEIVSYDAAGDASITSLGNRISSANWSTVLFGSAVGATGAKAFVGEFGGQLDFGTGPLATHGENDGNIFIVLVDPP